MGDCLIVRMSPVPLAVALMAGNVLMGALDAVIGRAVSAELHPFQITFFRNLFSLAPLLLVLPRPARTLDARGLWPTHGLRALLKLVAMSCYFGAIALIPIASVTAVAFTMPIFVMAASMIFLKEPLRLHRAVALGAGLIGMLIILQPGNLPFGTGLGLALASALCFAAVALLMKVTSGREEPLRIVWFNLLATVPMALALALPFWSWPSWPVLGLCALQGVGGLLAQLAFARSMQLADASLIIPVDFLRLPVAAALALLLFSEPISLATMIGGTVIFSGILFATLRERRMAPPGG